MNDMASNPRRNGMVAAAVVAVLLLVVGVGYAIQSQRDTTGEDAQAPGQGTTSASPDSTASAPVRAAVADTYGLGVGDPDAPVKVEIFEDFLCPFCGQLEAASRDQLVEAARNGEAFVVYRPIAFLNEYSVRSLNAFGVVLDKAGGETALRFHDLLFEQQPDEGGPMPDDEWLIELAVTAGASEEQVRPGIESMAFQQWIVNGSDDASRRQITGTPAVFVDGQKVEGSSIEDLAAQVQARIDAAS
jgi:protein-disulfide isomerase